VSQASSHDQVVSGAATPAPAADDPTQPLDPDASIGELLGRVTSDFSELVSTQIELAKVEIKEEVGKAGKAAGMLGGGAVCGYFALLLLSFALAWGLNDLLDSTWLGFLLVGLVYAVAAAVLALQGKKRLSDVQPVPEQTKETIQEDVQWAKQQMS
jgi:uncharacterized membrane protein YqjE